jgi:hypothetical protein
MWLLDTVAITCVVAGLAVIVLGFWLGRIEVALHQAVESAAKSLPGKSRGSSSAGAPGGLGATAEQQALVPDIADSARAIADLAKALKGLSPAVQAFLVSIIFFLIAAALAGIAVLGPS